MVLLPFSAGAHPGKTDYVGGHKCLKNCEEWELEQGEYHLHDKDWNPIHLDEGGDVVKTENPKEDPTPDKRFLLEKPEEKVPGARESSVSKIPSRPVITSG